MVITASCTSTPIIHDQVHVEKPALNAGLARTNALYRPVAETHRRQPGHAGNALLRSGINRVNPHRIHHRKTSVALRKRCQRLGIASDTGRGFRMDKSQESSIRMRLQCIFDALRIDGLSPFGRNNYRGCPAALNVFLHPPAKGSVLTHDRFVPRLQEVHKHGLHARRSRRGNGQGQRIPGLKRPLQQGFDFIHQGDELGVKMPDRGPGQRLKDSRVHIGGARPHQGSNGGME